MRIEDYRIGMLVLTVLSVSAGLWVHWLLQIKLSVWEQPVVPRRPVPWRLYEAVGIVLINLLCVSALRQQLFGGESPSPLTLQHVQANVAAEAALLVLIPLTLALFQRTRWADFGVQREGILEDVRFGMWGALISQLPIFLINLPLESIREQKPHEIFKLLQEQSGVGAVLIWTVILTVLMAPLLEELLFRVLMQGSLERDVSPAWAMVLTSMAFVATHQPVDWLPLMPLALMLSYCYYRRHSFLAVVVLHAVSNGINMLYAVLTVQSHQAGM